MLHKNIKGKEKPKNIVDYSKVWAEKLLQASVRHVPAVK